jgi:hypothetical protein
MQQPATLQAKLADSIGTLRRKYPSFEEAISSYTSQYGEGSVKVYEPFKIGDTIDPAIIILGRTTQLFYKNSKR